MWKLFIKNKYWQIPNEILNLEALSFRAKWLWAYMQSKPDWWDFSTDRIKEDWKEWRDAVRVAIQELEEHWLLLRVRVHIWDSKWEHQYHLLELETEWTEIPSSGFQALGTQAIKKEVHKKERISNRVNENSSSIATKKVRDHMVIVNEYENEGTFIVNELASKAVLNMYELSGLESLAVVFLDWCVRNKDKLEWKVNIKARFNKFVQTDYQGLLMKKATWPWVYKITDDEFITLMDEWYFRSSQCKFYQGTVKPTLDEDWLERFRMMVEFFRNKDIGWKKWKTFYEWAELKW